MNTKSTSQKSEKPCLQGVVTDLSHDGRGVVRVDNRVYFVAGALVDETVSFNPRKKRKGQFSGDLVSVDVSSSDRVEPKCRYFGVCGGCTLQHLDADKQVLTKQNTLLDTLLKIGKVKPGKVLPVIEGPVWGYRRKARPGVKVVEKKGGVLVGFREQGSSYLTSLKSCETLEPRLATLLEPLHVMVTALSCPNRVPQIEMAAALNGVTLVIRHLDPLTDDDLRVLRDFAENNDIILMLQPGGLDSIHPLWPENPQPMFFELEEYGLQIQFAATDFVQVNESVNAAMIDQAIDALDLKSDSKVLDLFCGLGNFTLPVATRCADVVGIEGDAALVEKGNLNIARNRERLGDTGIRFEKMDLHNEQVTSLATFDFNRLLVDPPRSGAWDVVTKLVPLVLPEVIVYISCNPATLARDAEVLVHQHGYILESAGAINMFPHTGHVESMAKFVRR